MKKSHISWAKMAIIVPGPLIILFLLLDYSKQKSYFIIFINIFKLIWEGAINFIILFLLLDQSKQKSYFIIFINIFKLL